MRASFNVVSLDADISNAMVMQSTEVLSLLEVVSQDFDATVVNVVLSTEVLSAIDDAMADVFPFDNMDVLPRVVISLFVVVPADIDASFAVVELS